MRWNIRGGYAWVFQNVPERELASANIELAPIGLTTILVQWTTKLPYGFNPSQFFSRFSINNSYKKKQASRQSQFF